MASLSKEEMLGEILAVIHRDGGQYEEEYGTEKATLDAIAIFYKISQENSELKERWRKTHEPSELRVQLARALEEIAELKREVRPVKPDEYNESYSKSLSQKL